MTDFAFQQCGKDIKMATKGFRQLLGDRQELIDSLVCVGLDPIPEKLPACLVSGLSDFHLATDIAVWMEEVIDATALFASMFKPQKAHWEAFPNGAWALQKVVKHIRRNHPGIPIFLDCKRNDIDRTQQRYQIAHFEIDGVDGMNFSPYMGEDCIKDLINRKHLERALVGLCYTSNPSAREIQDIELASGQLLWEFIAERTLAWAKDLGVVENAGLVMAAAYEKPEGSGNIYSEHLTRCREIVGNELWFLTPGIDAQGGFIAETVQAAYVGHGSIAINSSSGICLASQGEDFAEAAAEKARQLRDTIRAAQ